MLLRKLLCGAQQGHKSEQFPNPRKVLLPRCDRALERVNGEKEQQRLLPTEEAE